MRVRWVPPNRRNHLDPDGRRCISVGERKRGLLGCFSIAGMGDLRRPVMSGCFGHGTAPCDLRLPAPALRRGTSPWPLALDGRCIDLHRRTLRPSVARARPCAGGAAWRGAARRERAAPDGGREGAAGGGGEEAAGREGAAGEEPGRERRGGVGVAAPGVGWSRRRHGVGEELGKQPASEREQGLREEPGEEPCGEEEGGRRGREEKKEDADWWAPQLTGGVQN